ncbi:MAG: DUF1761 domain-containing protein [Paracoccaceae bacterium]
MQYLGVIVAALGAYAFGAVWYIAVRKQWMEAAGVEAGPDGRPAVGGKGAYFVALISVILVAGMMRHAFNMSSITEIDKGLVSGLGLGAFIATPWIATNYAFAGRSGKLSVIDGLYAIIGCGIIGLVLTLF